MYRGNMYEFYYIFKHFKIYIKDASKIKGIIYTQDVKHYSR
jgi:hypothetical protein